MKLHAQTIVITGASDGIGAAAARQLAARGERLVLVGRSPDKTRAIARELDAPYHVADFSELQQVRDLAETLRTSYPRIDVLANNAGGIMGERQLSADGFEMTLQVNHLAGFLLTQLLLPTLLHSRATVIQTASIAAERYGNLDIDDLQNQKNYSPQKAYGDAKLANILYTRELHRRYHRQGLTAAAFHPGIVATGFASQTTHPMRYLYHSIFTRLFTISAAQGADTLVWLAEGTAGKDWISGEYFYKRAPAKTNKQAYDDALASQLWERSLSMLDIPL